jgi:hypothetical protein
MKPTPDPERPPRPRRAAPDDPQPEERQPTFDEAVVAELGETAKRVLARHPEVRGVACTVDYFGALNDADVNYAVWIGRDGVVSKADGIVGGAFQQVKLLGLMFERGLKMATALRDALTSLSKQVADEHEKLEALRKEGDARGA